MSGFGGGYGQQQMQQPMGGFGQMGGGYGQMGGYGQQMGFNQQRQMQQPFGGFGGQMNNPQPQNQYFGMMQQPFGQQGGMGLSGGEGSMPQNNMFTQQPQYRATMDRTVQAMQGGQGIQGLISALSRFRGMY
jgi:hypothetical protein